MAKKYYTLVIREDGIWSPQFGDYDKSVVTQEAIDSYSRDCDGKRIPVKDRKVLTTGPRQADINAAVAALNSPSINDYCDHMSAASKLADTLTKERREGFEAYCQGKASGFNPYPHDRRSVMDTAKSIAWSTGWMGACIDPKE